VRNYNQFVIYNYVFVPKGNLVLPCSTHMVGARGP